MDDYDLVVKPMVTPSIRGPIFGHLHMFCQKITGFSGTVGQSDRPSSWPLLLPTLRPSDRLPPGPAGRRVAKKVVDLTSKMVETLKSSQQGGFDIKWTSDQPTC